LETIMGRKFFDLAFTPSVKAQQEQHGSRGAYARVEGHGHPSDDALSDVEKAFIIARDSFYLATVTETRWPYVQHRGGPAGFVRVVDDVTIGWAELTGNRQYISAGNVAADDRVAMIMVDYPRRRRLKIMGHMRVLDPSANPELLSSMTVSDVAEIERIVTIRVAAFDWNCPQHITPRYTAAQVKTLMNPLHLRIQALETALECARKDP
jgi:predicted pyridoxine 5'-phosphate oxidase superfamily flavin-nucleotide-binding protein